VDGDALGRRVEERPEVGGGVVVEERARAGDVKGELKAGGGAADERAREPGRERAREARGGGLREQPLARLEAPRQRGDKVEDARRRVGAAGRAGCRRRRRRARVRVEDPELPAVGD
jgi:hypothetical protein